ncbi:MAG TPA: LysR family transcriptional regulator, partial [Hyphomicrobiaceae bacterium]|nr:LysR family transcriptional regulator [Hyphomicrobiaceae bacterium]
MNAQPSWDDLRVLLAVARHGSLSGAARALGVNHSTVLRRVAALEAAIGTRLFDRLPGGYALTPAGDDMHMVAARLEEEIAAAQRRLAGRDAQPSGTVRVTTIDILALYVLPRHLTSFRAAYPGISIELVIAETPFSLTRREADVAIRATTR